MPGIIADVLKSQGGPVEVVSRGLPVGRRGAMEGRSMAVFIDAGTGKKVPSCGLVGQGMRAWGRRRGLLAHLRRKEWLKMGVF
jgi:hypothetical protein